MNAQSERQPAGRDFPVREAHELVRDLMKPHLPRYWYDLFTSAVIGWAAFVVAVRTGPGSAAGAATLVVSGLALYRAALFIHELVHFRRRHHIRQFGSGWNLLVGFGLLIPSFLYAGHSDHHSRRRYGTEQDPEYIPFARLPRREMVRVLAATPLVPLFGPLRFGLLAPVSWCIPELRRWVLAQASTIKLDLDHRAEPPSDPAVRRAIVGQELVCCLLVWSVAGLVWAGRWSMAVPVTWYFLMVVVIALNSLRLLGAHRYLGAGSDATIVGQMVDSVNCTSSRIAGRLWGPVGLRQHALHHLFPSMPYHSFPEAHRRLVAALPEGSAYHLTEEPGLLASITALWYAPRPAAAPGNAS